MIFILINHKIISKLSRILVVAADPKKGKEKTDYMKGVKESEIYKI